MLGFVDQGRTYIKFPPTVTNNNMPLILVDQLCDGEAPNILWLLRLGCPILETRATHLQVGEKPVMIGILLKGP